ncbi:MAG: hypothetical protein ABWZ75_10330 [Novosphingobium sp.]
MGASPNYVSPRLGPDGRHVTINTGISPNQVTWNIRSAFNVAALNCLQPQHVQILDGYKNLLTTHKKKLWDVNLKVDAEFRSKFGSRFVAPREAYMTQVYNYFAFPPTLMNFCDAVQTMSLESMTVKSADLDAFAARHLPALEAVFEDFFDKYDRYKLEKAAWDAQYGSLYPPQPATSTSQLILPPAQTPVAAPTSSVAKP